MQTVIQQFLVDNEHYQTFVNVSPCAYDKNNESRGTSIQDVCALWLAVTVCKYNLLTVHDYYCFGHSSLSGKLFSSATLSRGFLFLFNFQLSTIC